MPVTFESTELSPKDKAALFIIELLKYSDNKDDPVSDWEFNGIVTELDDDDVFNCICSTRIKYQYRIHRKINNMMYIDIVKSHLKHKQFDAIIHRENGRIKTVPFGQAGASDYILHKNKDRKMNYILRHEGMNEDWSADGYDTAGWLSRWLLWNKPSLKSSIQDINNRFKNIHVRLKN